MRLSVRTLSITAGLLWGLGLFCITWWIILFEGATHEPTFIGLVYRGYTISPIGSLIGLGWGLVDGFIGGAVFAWVYYTILGKPLVMKYGAIRVTAYSLSFGSAVYFPFGLYRALNFNYAAVPWTAWLSVLYAALGVSVTAYVLWYWLLKQMEASRLAVFNNIQPVIASVVAMLFLGEPINLTFILGGAIVLTGVLITET